jgi:hypothetical protein
MEIMKSVLVILMLMSVTVLAGYTYEIKDGDYFIAISLNDSQSMLVTGGGGYYLNLFDNSQTIVPNTVLVQRKMDKPLLRIRDKTCLRQGVF